MARKKKKKAKEDPISLPSVNEPSENLQDYLLLIYGVKKVGKSTLLSHFPDTLFFMFEPGGKSLPVRQVPDLNRNEPPLTWPRFLRYIDKVAEWDEVSQVVVDTIDRCYRCCFDYMCRSVLYVDHPQDEKDFGKTWGQIAEEFEKRLDYLNSIGKGVAYTSHSHIREVETRSGGKFDQIVPTMPGQAFKYMQAIIDLNAFYGFEGEHRELVIQGDDYVWAGCGLQEEGKHFCTTKGRQVISIPMGSSSQEAFNNLIKAFDNEQERSTAEKVRRLERKKSRRKKRTKK